MSGGPPHHPHGRQVPSANTAWNHLQVPNFFPRHPQQAHMSNEHSMMAPTWHTPTTTDAIAKTISHAAANMYGLLTPELFHQRSAPGVDLSLTTRNGSQNGELPPLPTTPISLSVRDTNKINSLMLNELHGLDIQPKNINQQMKNISPGLKSVSPGLISVNPGLKSVSPGLKSVSPGLKSVSPGLKSISPGLDPNKMTQKRWNVRVDSILERLNPNIDKSTSLLDASRPPSRDTNRPAPMDIVRSISVDTSKPPLMDIGYPQAVPGSIPSAVERIPIIHEKPSNPIVPGSVIVQAGSSHDDSSNSSSILNVPTPTNVKEEDAVSSYSNEDSLDSNKSRRKRKPSKTVRVSKEEEKSPENDAKTKEPEKEKVTDDLITKILEESKIPERRRSSDDLDSIIPAKTRRKTSSESETIDNIAAMVQECVKDKQNTPEKVDKIAETVKIVEKVIEATETAISTTQVVCPNPNPTPVMTPAQKKATNTSFVEVENKLEEMFAGIEDSDKPVIPEESKETDKLDDIVKLDEPSTSALTIKDSISEEQSAKKTKRRAKPVSRRSSDVSSNESTPKKKTPARKPSKKDSKTTPKTSKKSNTTNSTTLKQTNSKLEAIKDIYAYDSGSNASSSKSRGPFIQIKGPRDSPISVNVVNAPLDDDVEKKTKNAKKYHDDSEYRHKVRSKGLHCSTLSNKYDAQTKDATWICAFCKRGPHATELSGPTSNGEVIPAGDLFGPYFITAECPEFERRIDDPYDKQFKSKKITKVLDESNSSIVGKGKKTKRKQSDMDQDITDIYFGITDTGNKTYEIWAHEDCIVWSPGIYLVGPKIMGLEEAIWTSCNVLCKLCNLKGANICCLKRGCMTMVHLCCSRAAGWQFDGDNFKAYCPLHKIQ